MSAHYTPLYWRNTSVYVQSQAVTVWLLCDILHTNTCCWNELPTGLSTYSPTYKGKTESKLHKSLKLGPATAANETYDQRVISFVSNILWVCIFGAFGGAMSGFWSQPGILVVSATCVRYTVWTAWWNCHLFLAHVCECGKRVNTYLFVCGLTCVWFRQGLSSLTGPDCHLVLARAVCERLRLLAFKVGTEAL